MPSTPLDPLEVAVDGFRAPELLGVELGARSSRPESRGPRATAVIERTAVARAPSDHGQKVLVMSVVGLANCREVKRSSAAGIQGNNEDAAVPRPHQHR